jgi:response regulator RpfG family c-di-GMP phosphodiesterase
MTAPKFNTNKQPIRVLCVDDEPNILSALKRLLRSQGYQVQTAESGAGGLVLLAESTQTDVIISDMRMPEMDGAEFLECARQRFPDTIRILLTGHADIASTISAINQGEIHRYISKPWDDAALLLVISEALDRRNLKLENQRLLDLTKKQNNLLLELNEGLEIKVNERTAELAQVNDFLNLANRQLKQKFLVSVKIFSGLLEMRGGTTAGHSRRVGDMARRLAEECQLPAKEQNDVFLAGLLHDIGKIGFTDGLLARPVSTLSGSQMAEYCRHASAGEAALLPLAELKEAAHIIRSHHEQFNGRGFPDGLRGEEIPLGSRILAVANDYDGYQIGTLTEKRLTPVQALANMQQLAGSRYDPSVLKAFASLLEKRALSKPNEKRVPADQLTPGMVLANDLVATNGALLLATDAVLTPAVIKQIQNLALHRDQDFFLSIRTEV